MLTSRRTEFARVSRRSRVSDSPGIGGAQNLGFTDGLLGGTFWRFERSRWRGVRYLITDRFQLLRPLHAHSLLQRRGRERLEAENVAAK